MMNDGVGNRIFVLLVHNSTDNVVQQIYGDVGYIQLKKLLF